MTGPLQIVAIGGGTGLSALLAGLRVHASGAFGQIAANRRVDITAIVTVTDDGGSSGRLRREFDVLPPGDIRNCMVALSEDEALLSRLFRYRFSAGRGLKGHSFGNLFLTALTHITGDFPEAVKMSSEVLNIAGRIFPSTAANVALEAVLENGKVVRGESRISRSKAPIRRVRLIPGRVRPLPEALDAIAHADLITLGPGSLFTSVIPNLLVSGVSDAIRKSGALKACFVNLMTQPGETTNFKASDHVRAIVDHAGRGIIDCAVVNNTRISATVRSAYAAENSMPTENNLELIQRMGIEAIGADLVMRSHDAGNHRARHNPAAVARVAIDLAVRGRRRRLARG